MVALLDRMATFVVQILLIAAVFGVVIFVLAQGDRMPRPLVDPEQRWNREDIMQVRTEYPDGRFAGNKYVVCLGGQFVFLYADGTSEAWGKSCWR